MTTEQTNNESPAAGAEGQEATALGAAAAGADGAQGGAEGESQGGDPEVKDEAGKGAEGAADGGEAKKEGEGKEGGEAAAGAPETYDVSAFTMPEGVEFDAEGFADVEPVLRELNLSQDQAGKLMSAYAEKIVPRITERTMAAQDSAAAELRANLARDLQADPEVGGAKLDESRSLAAKAIAAALPNAEQRSEFSTFLNESGLGNHPLLMRVITHAGRALSEATTAAGEGGGTPLTESQKFYGKS